jgi:hypothetical protein
MSSINLKAAIEHACSDLIWINEAVAKIGSAGTLSRESNDFFQMSPNLALQLDHAKGLLPVRDAALTALLAFPKQISTASTGQFLYNGLDVTYKIGRYLLFQNYSVTTWALYDSITKVAGLLCCIDKHAKNPTKPIKLYEDFLQRENYVGARLRDHLKGAYGWPIAVSYKIRNWLAHDGHCHEGVELFKYDSLVSSGEFEMLEAAWNLIEDTCRAEPNQTRLQPFPELRSNLAQGLDLCHNEVDEAMAFLLTWSTGIARLQAAILFPRDAAATTSASPVPSP